MWDAIAREAAPIREIHVSDAGHFGFARLEAARAGLDAFGYMVNNRAARGRAVARARARRALTLRARRALTASTWGAAWSCARAMRPARRANRLHARLVVAADGAHSLVKQAAGIASSDARL